VSGGPDWPALEPEDVRPEGPRPTARPGLLHGPPSALEASDPCGRPPAGDLDPSDVDRRMPRPALRAPLDGSDSASSAMPRLDEASRQSPKLPRGDVEGRAAAQAPLQPHPIPDEVLGDLTASGGWGRATTGGSEDNEQSPTSGVSHIGSHASQASHQTTPSRASSSPRSSPPISSEAGGRAAARPRVSFKGDEALRQRRSRVSVLSGFDRLFQSEFSELGAQQERSEAHRDRSRGASSMVASMTQIIIAPSTPKARPQVTMADSLEGAPANGEGSPADGEGDAQGDDDGDFNSRAQSARRTCRTFCGRAMENRVWQVSFVMMTFYALFCNDVDMRYGTESSKFMLSVVTTFVFFFFALELVVQSCGKPGYLFGAYFWLDTVALVSLLPDTWLLQALTSSSEFVAARSSKISRVIRVASRSVKATRLNRILKIVRIAALLPKIAAAFSKKEEDEKKAILEKKLTNVFQYVDDDGDGFISQEMVVLVLNKLKSGKEGARISASMRDFKSTRDTTVSQSTGHPALATLTTMSSQMTGVATVDGPNFTAFGVERGEAVSFQEFKAILLADDRARGRLLYATKLHLKRRNNVQQITSRHSEDMGVKVALGVLLMLLVQSIVEPLSTDRSDLLGLQQLDLQVGMLLGNMTGDVIPPLVVDHVATWVRGVRKQRKLKYLDIRHRVFCDEFTIDGNTCRPPFRMSGGGDLLVWSPRMNINEIDRNLVASEYRLPGDLSILRLPLVVEDLASNLDDAALNASMTTLAVLEARDNIEFEAEMSIYTTLLVIVIILFGIAFLTRDMTFLSTSLLKPLRNLAEEMRMIVHLQLAGCEESEEVATRHVVAEINLIQNIFDNMKRAIKSWGKYVPWPVVKILLQAGEGATPGVREEEVTVFFSDIASFTTIVETLPPEKSLLLLSRYFNDMSKVIDEHDGIVIEFIGDAIVAVWGTPIKSPDHPTQAVKSTMRMLLALEKLNEWSTSPARGLPVVKIRCGVHTGPMLVGNMGFKSRMKYGIVGEHANIPPRLEELNKSYGTSMLMSRSTLSRLRRGQFVVRPIDFMHLLPSRTVGRSDVVYQVLGRSRSSKTSPALVQAAKMHAHAMTEYRKRNFGEAAALFAQVGPLMQEATGAPEDEPSMVMMKRALAYDKQPPRAGWDGVWDQLCEPP